MRTVRQQFGKVSSFTTALFVLSLGFSTILFTGCTVKPGSSLGDGNNSSAVSRCGSEPASITQQREQNFDSTLHALLLQQTCVQCHDGQSGRAPFSHSSTDLPTAYAAAVQLVDLGNPPNSTIVKKVQGDHNCGSDAQCQALAQQMISAIQGWSAKEAMLPPPPTCVGDLTSGLNVTLPGKAISPTSLSATKATTLRWDMGTVNSAVGKMMLSVDVLAALAPSTAGNGNYKIQNVIVASQDMRVKVLSIVPIINGKTESSYANFTGLNYVVDHIPFDPTASILAQAPVSDYPQYINWENPSVQNPSATDSLGFLVTVEATTDTPSTTTQAPGCKALDKFDQVYTQVLDVKVRNNAGVYVGQCTQCHGSMGNAANAVMNLADSYPYARACDQVLTRVNLTNPLQSLLLLKPSQADATAAQDNDMHPVKIDLLNGPAFANEKAIILQWINAEANAPAGGS